MSPRKIKVGIVGLGTVGGGFYDISKNSDDFEIVKVLNRSSIKYETHDVKKYQIASGLEDLIDNVDVVVETVGGTDFADKVVRSALKSRKHVVTANKALIAENGVELLNLAKSVKKLLLFGASVGGGMPVLKNLEYHNLDGISRVYGIINATSNFVMSKLSKGMGFEEAIRIAQKEGYAESDPGDDISGKDAARKLAIICAFITGCLPKLESIPITPLRIDKNTIKTFDEMGMSIKPLVYFEIKSEGAELWVGPAAVPKKSRLGITEGTENCLIVEGKSGINSISGTGAGKNPTAYAIMADVISIARGETRSVSFNDTPINVLESHFETVKNVKILKPFR